MFSENYGVHDPKMQNFGLILLCLSKISPEQFPLPSSLHPFRVIDYNPFAEFFNREGFAGQFHIAYQNLGYNDPFTQTEWKLKDAWCHTLESLFWLAEIEKDKSKSSLDTSYRIRKSADLAMSCDRRAFTLFTGKCLGKYAQNNSDLAELLFQASLDYATTSERFLEQEDLPRLMRSGLQNLGLRKTYTIIKVHEKAKQKIINAVVSLRSKLETEPENYIDVRQQVECALDALTLYPINRGSMFKVSTPNKPYQAMSGSAIISSLQDYRANEQAAHTACLGVSNHLQDALKMLE